MCKPGCGCSEAKGKPMNERYLAAIPENETWTPYTIVGGPTHRDIPCHVAVGIRGDKICAWARVHFAGMAKPVILSAEANLRDIEKLIGGEALQKLELEELADARAGIAGEIEIAGRSSRKARRKRRRTRWKEGIKRVAKKIGKSKVLRGIAKVAKKVVNNPLVKGVLAVVPGGQAVLAAQAGAKLAARAIKGGKRARQAITTMRGAYQRGNPKAGRMLGYVRQGLQAQLRRGGRFGRLSGDALEQLEDGQAFALIAGECLAGYGCVGLGADVMGADPNDDAAARNEADALATFSDGGVMWEPMRAALSRSMTARDALLEGREAQASRWQRAGRGQPWDVQTRQGARYRAA